MSDTEYREGSEAKESEQEEEYNGNARSPSPSHSNSRSKSRSRSKSKSRSRSYSRSPARSYSRSRSRSPYSRSRSRSRSRSKSRSRTRHKRYRSYSRSRSRSPYYKKRKRSVSPLSTRKRHIGNREAPDASRCLGVFGLSLYTTERDLRSHFEKYGSVESIQIVYDRQSGRSRGFAFVYYDETDMAIEAKEQTNGLEVDGRRIRVDYSITKRAHTPTPGVYMGKPSQHRDRRSSYDDYGKSSYKDSYRDSYRERDYRERDYYRSSYSRYSRSRSRSYSPRRY